MSLSVISHVLPPSVDATNAREYMQHLRPMTQYGRTVQRQRVVPRIESRVEELLSSGPHCWSAYRTALQRVCDSFEAVHRVAAWYGPLDGIRVIYRVPSRYLLKSYGTTERERVDHESYLMAMHVALTALQAYRFLKMVAEAAVPRRTVVEQLFHETTEEERRASPQVRALCHELQRLDRFFVATSKYNQFTRLCLDTRSPYHLMELETLYFENDGTAGDREALVAATRIHEACTVAERRLYIALALRPKYPPELADAIAAYAAPPVNTKTYSGKSYTASAV
jgi:hypothetical protein